MPLSAALFKIVREALAGWCQRELKRLTFSTHHFLVVQHGRVRILDRQVAAVSLRALHHDIASLLASCQYLRLFLAASRQ